MEGLRLYIRIAILGLMTLALTALVVAAMFSLHTTQLPAQAAQTSDKRYYSNESVPVARGQIYDRYGRDLVVNRISRSISIDAAALKRIENRDGAPEAASQAVLDLIMLCDAAGVEHEDTFPVTLYPYRYIEDDSQQTAQLFSRLSTFLERIGFPSDVSSQELMRILRVYYNIPKEWPHDDARRVVGVRYEAELRYEFGISDAELGKSYIYIPPYTFAQDVPVQLMTQILERDLTGVSVSNSSTREYRTDYAAHLLGRVGPIYQDDSETYRALGYSLDSIVGIDGIEKAAEPWLHGQTGVRRVETNSAGQITGESYTTVPQAGSHMLVSLDIRLQEAAERALERGIYRLRSNATPREGSEAQGGAAVVIDVKNGEVLAMASYPTFSLIDYSSNQAALNQDPMSPLYNRALSGTYEPGSVFKMCTGLAALECSVIKPGATIVDKGIYEFYASVDYTPRCHIYPGNHGAVNASTALKVSCNYYYYEVGRLLGIDNLSEYATNFGLGQPTGIELDFAENYGILAGPAYAEANNLRWYAGDTIAASIGQSYNNFTPLQLAVYTATIANGGTRYRPRLLKSVMAYDHQRTTYDIQPEVLYSFGFKSENIKAVQAGMRLVAQAGGTAQATFRDYPVAVAAKTGTAQTSSDRPDNAVFVAYAPYDDPEIAIAVVVEKGAGGSRAAPIAREIFDAYFDIQTRMVTLDAG